MKVSNAFYRNGLCTNATIHITNQFGHILMNTKSAWTIFLKYNSFEFLIHNIQKQTVIVLNELKTYFPSNINYIILRKLARFSRRRIRILNQF